VPTFALTDAGLETPRLLPDVRARVVDLWRAKFGANAQTSSDSPDGLIIDVLSLLMTLHWEGVAQLYLQSHVRTATGASLAMLLDPFGKSYLPATRSTANLVWYGADATSIPEGSIATTSSPDVRFATDTAVTTGTATWVARVDTVANLTLYRLTVNGVQYPITSGSPASGPAIVAALAVALTAGGIEAYEAGADADGRALLVVVAGPTVTVTAGGMTAYRAAQVASTATVEGPTIALAGTLNTVGTPLTGIEGVTTYVDADLGRLQETASELRARHFRSLNSGGNASVEAIRSRLLDPAQAPGVEQAIVLSNRTDDIDANGLDPHSVEAIVLGGEDATIANLLFQTVAAGDAYFGNTSVAVTDSAGGLHTVLFSRPTELYLHLNVVITPGEGWPTVGDPLGAIQAAIVAYLGEGGAGELKMGTDFRRFALGYPINTAAPGVAGATITADTTPAPGDTPTLLASDIAVNYRTILRVDSSRVTVTT